MAKAATEVQEQDLIKCGSCGSINCYIQRAELVCRVCGEENRINQNELPTLTFLKNSIWNRVNQDLKQVNQLKEDFLFSPESTPWKQYACFYNIRVFLEFGPVKL